MKNRGTQLQKIRQLISHFEDGDIPQMHQHEVNPGLPRGDRLNYLYFTLPVSLNFQRSSPALWQAALNTYNDLSTRYLFSPEEVVKKERAQIQKDLIKHKLGLQKNKHIDIWRALSQTFVTYYKSDPREFFKDHKNDVQKIIHTLRKTHKKDFPYLSGPKMANYWLYILELFTDLKLKNRNEISIIPDTHIKQASIELGISGSQHTPDEVADRWKELLAGTELSPVDMHPILWNWSRANFVPRV